MELSEIVIRLLIATTLGAVIGLEREYRKKNAGFRTMILISLGSAVLTIVSLELHEQFSPLTDPTRIISYIVSGVGFLGAGVIMKKGSRGVSGMTTAAAIWMVAALGMSSGAGLYRIGVVAVVIAVIALSLLPRAEKRISQLNEYTHYDIIVNNADFLEQLDAIFKENNLKIFSKKRSKHLDGYRLRVATHGRPINHEKTAWVLIDNENVLSFDS